MLPSDVKITAIIALYNGEKFIREAVRSLSLANEIIVVDDGSTDNGPRLVEHEFPNVRLIRKKNGGVSSARNLGLQNATNEFVVFLDQDDLLLDNGLAILTEALLARSNGDIAYGDYYQVNEEGLEPIYVKQPDVSKDTVEGLLRTCCSSTVCCLFRKSKLVEVGGFDVDMMGCEDWDLYLRLALAGAIFEHVDKPVYAFRFYSTSTSKSFWIMWKCFRQFEEKHRLATLSSRDGKRLEMERRDKFLDDNLRHLYGLWDESCGFAKRRINRTKKFLLILGRDSYLSANIFRRAARSITKR